MPRGPRLDAPGALHHVMVRGIDRCAIFQDAADRQRCRDRLGAVIRSGGGALYAWCFMPNHIHALIRTGPVPLSRLMRRWIGPYATAFNRRHQRCGYLFQNRFKSILVEEERYFVELVRYIHLKPLRAQLVSSEDLENYPWTGHAVLLGRQVFLEQDTDFVLAHFGTVVGKARAAYREFVRAPDDPGVDLEGGGLRRSAGLWRYLSRTTQGRERWAHDERILGRPEFVQNILAPVPARAPSGAPAAEIAALCTRAGEHFGVSPAEIASPSLRRRVLAARAVVCHLAVCARGFSLSSVARCLGITRRSVVRAVARATTLLAAHDRQVERFLG